MGKAKILLVEDEITEAMDIQRRVEALNYSVSYITSRGDEAIEKAKELKPDLVLMDIVLKGPVDGIDAASEIKKLNIPFIYLTAHSEEYTLKRANLTEPYGYIVKPFNSIELKYAIELALHKSKQDNELKESEERYRALFNNLPGVVHFWKVIYKNGKIVDWIIEDINPPAEELWQVKIEDIRGKSTEEIVPGAIEHYYPIVEKIMTEQKEYIHEDYFEPLGQHILYSSIPIGKDHFISAGINITSLKKAQKELKESTDSLKLILDSAAEAIYGLDSEGCCTFVNPACLRLLGYEEEELLGKFIHNVIHHSYSDGRDYPHEQCPNHRTLKTGERFHVDDEVFWKKNGTNINVEYWSYPQIKDNKVIGAVVTFLDITPRKLDEKKLTESEEKYRNLFETMSQGVVYQNAKGEIISSNPAAEKILGLSFDEMIGRTSTDPLWKSIHEDGSIFPGEEHPAMVSLKTGKSVKNSVMGVFDPKNNETRWININAMPQFKENESQPYQVYSTFEDITERKRAEKDLKESEKSLAEAQCIGNIGSWEWNVKTGHLKWSDELYRIYGLDPSSYTPTMDSFANYIHPDDLEKINNIINQIISEGLSLKFDFRIIKDDGSTSTLWTTAGVTEYDDNGDPLITVGINQDITERKKVEDALKKSEESFRNLFETMAQGVVYQDEYGRIISANPAAEKILGLTLDEMQGKTSTSRRMKTIHEDGSKFPDEEHPAIKALKTGKKVKNIVMGVIDQEKDKTVWVNVTATPQFKENESPPYQVYTTIEDMTERKKAEEKYRNALDNMMEGCQIISHEWKYLYVNEAVAQHGKIQREDLLGHTMMEMYPGIDDTEMFQKIKIVMEERKACHFDNYFIYPDGNGRWFELRAFPVPEGIFILSIDINERKTAEEELLLRSEIMENMEDGVSLVQVSDGNFVYTNPKFDQIFGFEEDELIGTNVAELTAPTEDESPEEVAKKIIGSLHDDGVWSGEMLHSKKDGTVFWGYANISIFKHYEYGEVFLGVHTDITERKELQEELIDSKEFTESIIDSMADGLAVVDSNGVHLDVNQALCQMTGYSPEELIGTGPPHPYWPQEEYEKIQNSFEKIMNGNVNEIEIIFKKKNGKRFPVILSPSILTDEKGNLTNALAIIKDITERKRMEEIIRDNEARLSLALDAATMGVWDWDMVNNTTIRTLEHDKIFGYDSLLPEWNVENLVEHIIPEDREQIQKLITNPGGQNFFNFQCRIKRTDDQIRWIQVDGKVFHDKNNKPIRILGVVRDITDFKDIENELRASEEKYHTLFDKNPEYTILLGLDGTIQDVNLAAQQIVGNTAKELIGKHFTEIGIFPPDDLQKFMKKYKFHSEDDSQSYEMKIIDKNGQTRWTNVTTTIIEKLGKPNNILIISSDITERKKAENKIKESLIEKETLLKEIHHRVKNNMQIITSMLNLQTDYIQDTNTKDILIESRNRVKSMAMIHEKLYLSSDLSHINFRDYVRNLVSDIFYSYTIQLGTIDLVFDIEDVELNMETAMPLGLIINEIVTNSLKFAFPENIGSVIIKMKSQNGSFNLVIADDGIGLPDDFDFEKPKSLGLQLVKSLVEQIDGEIEVDNSNGTCYKINFKELLYKKRI